MDYSQTQNSHFTFNINETLMQEQLNNTRQVHCCWAKFAVTVYPPGTPVFTLSTSLSISDWVSSAAFSLAESFWNMQHHEELKNW